MFQNLTVLDSRPVYASLVSRRRRFTRIVLPTLWLVIGSVIAVSLAVLAFGGASGDGDDPLTPTATNQSETVPVQVGSIENTLTVDGSVAIDAPVDVKATDAGTLAYVWVPDGGKVAKGAPVVQLKVPVEPTGSGDESGGEEGEDVAPSAPTFRYVNLVAPTSGTVSGLGTKVGDDVDDDAVVAKIRRESFTVTGSVTPLDRYRLLDAPGTATVTINGGPEPFECSDLTIADTSEAPAEESGSPDEMSYDEGGESGGGTDVTCKVPSDVTVFDGLSASMEIDAGSVEDALTVPVTSVRGLVEKGAVWVVGEDGEPTQRAVTLGLSDGSAVQVVKGLEEGDEVLRYVPGSSPEEQMDDGYFEGEVVY